MEKSSKTLYSPQFSDDTNSWKAAQKKKNVILDKIEEQKNNIMRFKLMEEYSMDESEEEVEEELLQSDEYGDIIEEEDEFDEQSAMNGGGISHSKSISLNLEEELPEQSKTYYKIFNQCQVLKNSCETALGMHKFMRACQLVEKGASRTDIIEAIGKESLGYWHLIEQTMFFDSLLREMEMKN